jgi:epoxyqueuosine reductase
MSAAAPIQDLLDHALAQKIKEHARALGFDLVGIAPAAPSAYRDYLRNWLDAGQAGEMAYLANRFEERTNPATYLPGAASVICIAINYYQPLEERETTEGVEGRIARYALGDDYHEIVQKRLHSLADWLRESFPGVQTRCGVDTAPIMEKELAARAGVGWVGKNTCLINPQIGSWLLLGEIITTLALPVDEPATDHCGTCQRCIEACPTQAITAPYQLDARRCISYLTIEHRGDITPDLQQQIGDWLYGCDICQDVCPHNRKAVAADDPMLKPRFASGTLDAGQVIRWDKETYQTSLRRSAMKRVKLTMIQRNAQIVLENSTRSTLRSGMSPITNDQSPMTNNQ